MALPDYQYLCRDALEFCKGLPTGSIKLIVTSPPYNIGKEYETRTNIEDYIDCMKPMLTEFTRILADDGSLCWQTGNYIEAGEVFPLDIYFYSLFKSLGLKLRNRVIWHFGHGLHCTRRFSGRYETVMWYTKGEHYIFNLDDVRVPAKYPGKRHYKGPNKGQVSGNPKGKNPEDVWEITLSRLEQDWEDEIWDIPNVKAHHPEKVNHPCQFPIELAERFVLALTNEGDVVYDPFAGVGSSLIAALKNGRVAFGTDLEQKYVDLGLERIGQLAGGTLKVRPISQKVYQPSERDKVAQRPSEWDAP